MASIIARTFSTVRVHQRQPAAAPAFDFFSRTIVTALVFLGWAMPFSCAIATALARSMSAPRVSVVIPTKNAGAHFERTLAAIAAQKLDEPF
jgi:hypothetical protein